MATTHHSFDIEHAKKYGLDEAVFIHSLKWWAEKNRADGNHQRDGRSWVRLSTRAAGALFPYWSRRQIDRVIASLAKQGIVRGENLTGDDFNETAYDRTFWYGFEHEERFLAPFHQTVKCTSPNGEIECTERGNRNAQTGKCTKVIPDLPKREEGGYTEGGASTLIDRQAEYRTDPPAARHSSRIDTSEPLLGSARQRADQWVNSNAKLLDRELGFSNFLPLRAFLEELFGRYPDLSLPPDLLDFALKDAKEHSEGSSWGVSCRAFETGLRKALARAQANGGLPRIGRSEARGAH